MNVSSDQLFAALEATWPPVSSQVVGPFRVRNGAGGGKRVSAAVLEGSFSETAFADVADQPLFQLRRGQDEFDQVLEARGYAVKDPTILYAAPIGQIAEKARPVSLMAAWPPLAMQRQIWADGDVGPARVAVMERACDPKNGFIARYKNRAAGVAFLSIHEGIAMLHALHIEPDFRRQGVARYVVRGMAHWAQEQGAQVFALAVTLGNSSARGLYSSLGMAEVDAYHYREKQT